MFIKNSWIHKKLHILLFSFFLLFLAGCSLSEQEAIEASLQTFDNAVEEETKEANEETENIDYYLPNGFTVDSEVNNNIVIEHQEQTYILFVNPFESDSSEVVYETTLAFYEEPIVNITLEKNGSFIFLIVDKGPSDDTYEVIVGIGGKKMTTITEVDNMNQSVQDMLDIIKSVTIK